MRKTGLITPVESSYGTTLIVTPLNADGQTRRICGDYGVALNENLLKRTCTTEGPEDVLNRFSDSEVSRHTDVNDDSLQVPLGDTSSLLTIIRTRFEIYKYDFFPFSLHVPPEIYL